MNSFGAIAGPDESQPALAGNFGSQRRMDYTAIGDTVNLASRLEGLNRRCGTRILISAATLAALGDRFEVRVVGRVAAHGRSAGIEIFERMAPAGELDDRGQQVRAAYEEGYWLYLQRDWDGAAERFEEALAGSGGNDGPARVLLALCRTFAQSPPPEPWDGGFVLTEK